MIDHVDNALRSTQNAVVGRHPATDRLIQRLTDGYALSWIYARMAAARVRHAAPIHPGRLLWVDPADIQRTVSWTRISADRKGDEHPRFRAPNYRLAGRVFDGEWDQREALFEQSTIYQSFVDHFEHGVAWERTAFYEESTAALAEGATLWGCETPESFDERCNEIDRLYDRIRTNGYRTQRELHDHSRPIAAADRLFRAVWGEIAVSVGRDGEWLFVDGRNRLAIAKIQEVDAVPVVVLVRHSGWQQLRNRVVRGAVDPTALPADVQSHPDIVTLF